MNGLQVLARAILAGTAPGTNFSLPSGMFFVPNQKFWDALRILTLRHDATWIDCGAGQGQITMDARAENIKMKAIDLMMRDYQHPCVQRADAMSYEFLPHEYPLICRPDHSGWSKTVVENAVTAGKFAVYVGLERNVEHDLDLHCKPLTPIMFASNVGKDGENFYVIGEY